MPVHSLLLRTSHTLLVLVSGYMQRQHVSDATMAGFLLKHLVLVSPRLVLWSKYLDCDASSHPRVEQLL